MKLAVNAYMSVLIEGVAESLALVRRLGIDTAQLNEAIEGGPLDAPIADAKLHKMEAGDFAPEFPLEWALKDVDLAIGAAGDCQLLLLVALSHQRRAAVDAGHGRGRQRGGTCPGRHRLGGCRTWPRVPLVTKNSTIASPTWELHEGPVVLAQAGTVSVVALLVVGAPASMGSGPGGWATPFADETNAPAM